MFGPRYLRGSGLPSPEKGSRRTSRTISRTRTAFFRSTLVQYLRSWRKAGSKTASRLFPVTGNLIAEFLDVLDGHPDPAVTLKGSAQRPEEPPGVPRRTQ